jgi:hypothetical protein
MLNKEEILGAIFQFLTIRTEKTIPSLMAIAFKGHITASVLTTRQRDAPRTVFTVKT